jgi:hypothetical protein
MPEESLVRGDLMERPIDADALVIVQIHCASSYFSSKIHVG